MIPTGEQSGWSMRIVVRADEKLTAVLELESVIRACGELS
jgi:hypothetical protein